MHDIIHEYSISADFYVSKLHHCKTNPFFSKIKVF